LLIVDDVATNRDVLADLLTRTGFDIRAAADGKKPSRSRRLESATGAHGSADARNRRIEAIRRLRLKGSRAVLIALTPAACPMREYV